MKRITFTLTLVITITVGALAQTPNSNCFDEYFSLFRQRGAKKVPDGDQSIVVAFKKDNVSRCFMGKVAVKNGEFVPPILIEKADGSFEEFTPVIEPAFANIPVEKRRKIEDGMTITFTTIENESLKGFFINSFVIRRFVII